LYDVANELIEVTGDVVVIQRHELAAVSDLYGPESEDELPSLEEHRELVVEPEP
jgi:hypothetical protein